MADRAAGRFYGVDQSARSGRGRIHLQHAKASRYTLCGSMLGGAYCVEFSDQVTCQCCRSLHADG